MFFSILLVLWSVLNLGVRFLTYVTVESSGYEFSDLGGSVGRTPAQSATGLGFDPCIFSVI